MALPPAECPPSIIERLQLETSLLTSFTALVDNRSTVLQAGLEAPALEHLHAVIAQLLAAEAVSDIPTWLPVVVRLATEAAQSLSPSAISARSVLDPRYYVHVKKVVDAQSPSASRVVQVRTRPACMFTYLIFDLQSCSYAYPLEEQIQHK